MDRKKEKLLQPFLLVQGSQEQPVHYNLVVEDTLIPVGQDCTTAFKRLFASFFVFVLHFPPLLRFFYKFFSEHVFAIEEPTPSTLEFVSALALASDD